MEHKIAVVSLLAVLLTAGCYTHTESPRARQHHSASMPIPIYGLSAPDDPREVVVLVLNYLVRDNRAGFEFSPGPIWVGLPVDFSADQGFLWTFGSGVRPASTRSQTERESHQGSAVGITSLDYPSAGEITVGVSISTNELHSGRIELHLDEGRWYIVSARFGPIFNSSSLNGK